MKIVDITTCIKITEENDMYGIERYLDIGSKIKITFNSGNTLTGYVQYLDYGHYPGENVLLVLKTNEDTLLGAMVCFISNIEVL